MKYLLCSSREMSWLNDFNRLNNLLNPAILPAMFERILDIENEVEARLLEKVLKEKEIPFEIKSNHDTAYDGLFQAQLGWGYLLSPPEYKEEISGIYNDITGGSS